MPKRTLSVLLIVTLLVTLFAFPVSAEKKELPKAGDKVSGFTVKEVKFAKDLNANTVTFTHDKTGATVLYVNSSDNSNAFSIGFFTPGENSSGLQHILEHSLINGSEKYPDKDLFYNLMGKTLTENINAFTYPYFTAYPLSAFDQDQLFVLADAYLSCIFQPLILTDKRIFEREGIRLDAKSADEPFIKEGVVYNEMKGSENSPVSALYFDAVFPTLFPDSYAKNNSGGISSEIFDLTYEELTAFYKEYYHPSNSFSILYGDLDYARFLSLIDKEYFSKYERKEKFAYDESKLYQKPFAAPTTATATYPVTASMTEEQAAKSAYAVKAYSADKVSADNIDDYLALNLVAAILQDNASPVITNLKKAGIAEDFAFISSGFQYFQPAFGFIAININKEDVPQFEKIIDETLAEMVEKGIDQKLFDGVLNMADYSVARNRISTMQGFNNIGELTSSYFVLGDATATFNYEDNYAKYKKLGKKYFEGLLEKYFVNNNYSALITMVPDIGGTERSYQKEIARIDEIKKTLSNEEIAALVKNTADFYEWNTTPADPAIIKPLQIISPSEWEFDYKDVKFNKKTTNGVEVSTSEVSAPGIYGLNMFIDATRVPQDKLHYLKLYSMLLGNAATKNKTADEVKAEVSELFPAFSVSVEPVITDYKSLSFYPAMSVYAAALTDDLQQGTEIIKEVLYSTDFSKSKDKIKEVINSELANYKLMTDVSPNALAFYYATAPLSEPANFQLYMNYGPYYEFLQGALENIDTVANELTKLASLVNVNNNAKLLFVSDKKTVSAFDKNAEAITSGLKKSTAKQVKLNIPKPKDKNAIESGSTVHYIYQVGSLKEAGLERNGKNDVITGILTDAMLLPKIRIEGGAYGTWANSTDTLLMLGTYKDPNAKKTLEVFKAVPDFMEAAALTQEQVDAYILSTLSNYYPREDDISRAIQSFMGSISGRTNDVKREHVKQIRTFKPSDLKEYAPAFRKMIEQDVYTIVVTDKTEKDIEFDEVIKAK